MDKHYEIFLKFKENLKLLTQHKELYENEKMFLEFMTDFKDFLYKTIHEVLEPNKEFDNNENYIRFYVKYIIKSLLPICEIKIKQYGNVISNVGNKMVMLNNWVNLEDDYYALASFRSIKHFAYYIERGTVKKVWKYTMPLFESYFYYTNQMILNNNVDKIRSSYFPGAGKTYSGNITCAYWFGIDNQISILRITYSDDLAKTFTKQIANIVESEQYKKVFPKLNIEPKELYKTKNAGELWFSFSNGTNFYATTRDGQSTGKRAKVIMIDDITKGAKEAYKIDVHKQVINMYDSDWSSRGDDDDQKLILMGTMWSPYDLLNVVQQRAERERLLKRDKKFKYCLTDEEEKNIFISVPILDYDTDESTCPLRYSTEKMRKKRAEYQDKSLFNAIYQQMPDAPSELIFDWKNLEQYKEGTFPKEILDGNYECRAMIDPNRKGFDYFCMWICKRYPIDETNDIWSKWYLVDMIYRKEIAKKLINEICKKIINHNISKLTIEVNTATELEQLLTEHLKPLGYNDIEIEEIFTTEKKEEKIANAKEGLLSEIVYPDQYMYSETSEIGLALMHFTTYDCENARNNKHDDCPDCGSMFVKYNCELEESNSMEVLSNDYKLF